MTADNVAREGEKGPRVWLDMDQRELDDAYDQRKYAPNRDVVMARRVWMSDRIRKVIGAPQTVAYGATAIETLDFYRCKQTSAPVHVFIHGGAWRFNKAADYLLQAEPFLALGAHYVVPDFTNVDETKGILAPMFEQVMRACRWVFDNAASFGGDRSRIYLSAHSSGAHLAACVLAQQDPLPFAGAMLISGMYDLEPVRRSKRSQYVAFTDWDVDNLSAQRHLHNIRAPLILAHGSCETPEFQRQTRDFCRALQDAGKSAELLVGEGYNHFELLETMASPYGLLGRAALQQMRLA